MSPELHGDGGPLCGVIPSLREGVSRRYFGLDLVSKVTRTVRGIESIELGGEQPNVSAEGIARLRAQRVQQLCLRRPETVIEAGEKLAAVLGGDDLSGAPVGRIGAARNQTGGFEVIEEVGHDRSVDSEMLGERDLATDGALGGGGEHLVAPWTTRKVSHRAVGGLDIGPENHAQAPSKVIGQRLCTAGDVPNFISVTSVVAHQPMVRAGPRSVAHKILF